MAPIEGHKAKLANLGKLSEVLVDEGERPELDPIRNQLVKNAGQYLVWELENNAVLCFHLVCFRDATEQQR